MTKSVKMEIWKLWKFDFFNVIVNVGRIATDFH
jgi:hypothetical protein